MFAQFLKRNNVLLVFLVLFLLTVSMVLRVIDRQFYQSDKRDIIHSNYETYIGDPIGQAEIDNLKLMTRRWLESREIEYERYLSEQIVDILDGENIVYRIALQEKTRAGEETFLINRVNDEKFDRLNRWSNSLFLHNFSGKIGWELRPYGRLFFYYTSPINDAQINELTMKYRWYSAFVVLILGMLAYVVARSLLFPMREVTAALDASTPQETIFIHQPRTRLEALYNRMALQAVVARLHGALRDVITRSPQMTSWEIARGICEDFHDKVDLPMVGVVEISSEGPGDLHPTGQRFIAGDGEFPVTDEALAELIVEELPHDGRENTDFEIHEGGHHYLGMMQLLPDPQRSSVRYLFAVALDLKDEQRTVENLPVVMRSLMELVDAGLTTLSLRNQLLIKERGRANISLSRNLGHDLTNIIATSKLELMALDRLLKKGDLPQDDRRRMILGESLHGLLSSVRFMQETVNLYRAYAFLQHPVLEISDGNELINETLDLFGLSISSKINLRRDLTDTAPRCVVDPRLVKLAVFNVFSNALKAIRQKSHGGSAEGWIRVSTGRSDEGGLRVTVEDSGTGILNHEGERAQPHEIEKIFELGYTRKAKGAEGEGLGLNWVRTIIEELHGGKIYAENTANDGARFTFVFPSISQAPDLKNAEARAAEYLRTLRAIRNPDLEDEEAEEPAAVEPTGSSQSTPLTASEN